MILVLLTLIVNLTHGHLIAGPTYIAAEWSCGLEYDCYIVVSWADGTNRPLLVDYDFGLYADE